MATIQPFVDGDPRFWQDVEITDSCWLWSRATDGKGYGHVRRDKSLYRAHRYAYQILKGSIPEDLMLDHICRVRRCVNPDHLEPVTNRENLDRSPAYGIRGSNGRYIKGACY